jgi:hypothetical protein
MSNQAPAASPSDSPLTRAIASLSALRDLLSSPTASAAAFGAACEIAAGHLAALEASLPAVGVDRATARLQRRTLLVSAWRVDAGRLEKWIEVWRAVERAQALAARVAS